MNKLCNNNDDYFELQCVDEIQLFIGFFVRGALIVSIPLTEFKRTLNVYSHDEHEHFCYQSCITLKRKDGIH